MCKVLVVDDEPMMRDCVKAILCALGHEVIEARDGVDALLRFQTLRGELALILMDVNMPRMDGFAAAKVIKTCNPDMKVILFSGGKEGLPEDVPIDAFLPKPFRARELASLVQQVLGDGRPVQWVGMPAI